MRMLIANFFLKLEKVGHGWLRGMQEFEKQRSQTWLEIWRSTCAVRSQTVASMRNAELAR